MTNSEHHEVLTTIYSVLFDITELREQAHTFPALEAQHVNARLDLVQARALRLLDRCERQQPGVSH